MDVFKQGVPTEHLILGEAGHIPIETITESAGASPREEPPSERGPSEQPALLQSPCPKLIRKPKAILIAVSDGFGGYGDFLFALKLSEQLKKKYADKGAATPPIYLVSQPAGKEKIKTLGGDKEFSVEVLTPDELKEKVDKQEIDVGTLMEGPVFLSHFIEQINGALANAGSKIPLIMLPEYGYSDSSNRDRLNRDRTYRQRMSGAITYADIVYSGFKNNADETGILLSGGLVHPACPDVLVSQLDEKIRTILLNLVDYQASTELSMQYSHDTYSTNQTPAAHFLNVHREFSKISDKSQDVLMVGSSKQSKHTALMNIKEKLISDGYMKISFYNAENKQEEVLYDADVPGKKFRVIYVAAMSHISMIACSALSGPLSGATGDQSLGEALSANKWVVYECLSHKQELINNYDAEMSAISKADPDVQKTLKLLRDAEQDDEYQDLARRLLNPTIQEKLKTYNQALLARYDLIDQIVGVDEAWELKKRTEILAALRARNDVHATAMLTTFRSRISVIDLVEDKTILQHAIEHNPKGSFVKGYYHSEIVRLLEAGQQQHALDFFLVHEVMIGMNDRFKEKPLYQHARDQNPDGVFVHYDNLQYVVSLIDKRQDGRALQYIQQNNLSVSDEYKGRALWEHAFDKKPESLVFRHAYESDDFLQTLRSVAKLDIFLSRLTPELFFTGGHTKPTLFARSIDAKVYGLADHIILNTKELGNEQKLCEVLQSQSQRASGETYLATLRKERPASEHTATQRASLLSTMNQLDKYEPDPSSRRAQTYPFFREIVDMFSHRSSYDDRAFIGLLIVNMNKIDS